MSATDEIDEMIRLRATRVPSINQMQGWKLEIERLRAVVAWYGDEAQAIAKALNGKTVIDNPQAIEASLTVLALDAGRKATAALANGHG